MNAPDAMAPRATFQREGQGRLQYPEHRLPSHVTGYAVLKTQRTGSIPRLIAAPPDSNEGVTFGRPSAGDSHAQGSRPQPVNIPMPPGRFQTVTVVAGAPAFASMLQRPCPGADRLRHGLKSGTNLAFHQSSSADPPGPEKRLKPSFQDCKPYSETATAMRFTNMAQKYLPLSAPPPRLLALANRG